MHESLDVVIYQLDRNQVRDIKDCSLLSADAEVVFDVPGDLPPLE